MGLLVDDFSDFGGETEELDSPLLRRGWVKFAADLTRRASGLTVVGGSAGDAGRCVEERFLGRWTRALCRCETESGVALPELEPVPLRNREMPSAGIEGSLAKLGSWLWLKAGEPVEPLGVMVANTLDIFASGRDLLRSRRRWDTSSPSNGCEYLDVLR
jgi:hypothetical protein